MTKNLSTSIHSCAECGSIPNIAGGLWIYPHRLDLADKYYYLCHCGAYVGCHKGSTIPLGSPCGNETREARIIAHSVFDKIWKQGTMTRKEAYKWLSSMTDIPKKRCHIGMMNLNEANLVISICKDKLNDN